MNLITRAYVNALISPRVDRSWPRSVPVVLLLMLLLLLCGFSMMSSWQIAECTGSWLLHNLVTYVLWTLAYMPVVIYPGNTYDSRGMPQGMRAGSMRARVHVYLLMQDASTSALLSCLSLTPLIVYSTCMALTCPDPSYDEMLFCIASMLPGTMTYWLFFIYKAKLEFFRAVADRELAWRVLVSEPRRRRR